MSIFTQITNELGPILVDGVKSEILAQGHKLTGSLLKSVEARVKGLATAAQVQIWLNDYGVPLNTGVPAQNIPYTAGSGATSSAYIQGLILYARLRFRVPISEAKSIAFAIANKHKAEGMPTKASRRFSSTGKRTEFLQEAQQRTAPDVEAAIERAIERAVVDVFAVLTEARF